MRGVTDWGSDPRLSTSPVLSKGSREGFLEEEVPNRSLRMGKVWT